MINQYYIVNTKIFGTSSDGFNQYFDMVSTNTLPSTSTMYVVTNFTNGSGPNIATTTDGTTWTTRTVENGHPSNLEANITHSDTLKLVVATINGYYSTSTNGGITWVKQTTPFTFRSVKWVGALGIFIAVGTNNIATSSNGFTWTIRNTATYDWKDVEWNGTRILVMAPNRATHSTNGTSWTNYSTTTSFGGDNTFVKLRLYGTSFVRVGNASIYVTTTGLAGSWATLFNTDFPNTIGQPLRDIVYSPVNTYWNGVASSSVGKNIWYADLGDTVVTPQTYSTLMYSARYVTRIGSTNVFRNYVAGASRVLRYTTNGTSWTDVTLPNSLGDIIAIYHIPIF